uniref:Pentacotripeptide-repeat region of PRORP domain-containing protein n=1 Tax=Oryza meridionalis TaxID=40149 RepID=A0A0E0CPM2_9ORYZ
MHGFYINVLEMFKQMEEESIQPDELTFSTVLTACNHAGLVKDCWRMFNSMTSVYSVLPQEEYYGCMVDLLGRAGHLEDGYKFIKLSTLKDKSTIFCALLSACKTHRNTQLALAISKELLEHGPQKLGIYALISEVYAQEGQWNEFTNTRARANLSGLKKHPGSSFIESMEQGMNGLLPLHEEQKRTTAHLTSLSSQIGPKSKAITLLSGYLAESNWAVIIQEMGENTPQWFLRYEKNMFDTEELDGSDVVSNLECHPVCSHCPT